jgi:hypothetical protein
MRRALEGKLASLRSDSAQRRSEPFPCALVARNSESQPVGSLCEQAGQDFFAQELFKGSSRVGMSGQSIELCSAGDTPAGVVQESGARSGRG